MCKRQDLDDAAYSSHISVRSAVPGVAVSPRSSNGAALGLSAIVVAVRVAKPAGGYPLWLRHNAIQWAATVRRDGDPFTGLCRVFGEYPGPFAAARTVASDATVPDAVGQPDGALFAGCHDCRGLSGVWSRIAVCVAAR
ncbi:hypothetical protein D3C78_1397100 [compost metagenome]